MDFLVASPSHFELDCCVRVAGDPRSVKRVAEIFYLLTRACILLESHILNHSLLLARKEVFLQEDRPQMRSLNSTVNRVRSSVF